MKRFTLIAALVLATVCAGAQQMYYQNEATLRWDAVTVDAAGDPFLPTDVVEYEVYIFDYVTGVTSDQDPAQLTLVGSTENTEQLIVFPYRTSWAAGVRCKVTDAGANVDVSPLAWSYVPVDVQDPPGPFLYTPFPSLRAPAGLRDSGM